MTSITATILVTDVVGSTEQRVRLGEEAADDLRRRHDRILAEVVRANHGTLVKGLGDGILARFGSASDALGCAVGIQQTVDRYCRENQDTLSVRVGMSTGDVSVEDDDVFGIPVVEAARLCAAADGGQILVGDLVRLTARNRGGHAFTPIGAIELKGLADPLDVSELLWTPIEVGAMVALPPALAPRDQFGFVGRADLRSRLGDAWIAAGRGHRGVVFLSGEAGVGKTRLASEVARAAHEEHATVLFGGCEEALAAPYRPWIEALEHLFEHAPDEVIAAIDPSRLADVGRVIPRVRVRVEDLPPVTATDPETERYLFYSGVVAVVTTLAQRAPVMVLLDDLHWADQPSLALLQHVLRNTQDDRLLIVGTYRDTDLARANEFADALATLGRAATIEHLAVGGLDATELTGLVEAAMGADGGEHIAALADALRDETSGNAFFASELLRHFGETGTTARQSLEQLDQIAVPTSVRSLIEQRIARLGGSAATVLARAAVVGVEFDFALMQRIGGVDDVVLLDTLEQAEAAGLVESTAPGRFRFAHALVQHGLYAELSVTRRSIEHAAIARSLEELGVSETRPAESARHWAAADTDEGLRRAIHFSRLAGERASAALAPQEAARQFTVALELLDRSDDDPALRCELLLLLAAAQCHGGDPAFRHTVTIAADLAAANHDADRLVRAALTDYQRGYMSLNDPDRPRILEAALEAVGEHDSPQRATLLSALSLELSFSDVERSGSASREARAIAGRLGDAVSLAQVWLHGGGGRFPDPEGLATRRSAAIDAMTLVRTIGDPGLLFSAAFANMQSSTWFAELDRFDEHIGIMVDLAREIGRPDFQWIATYCRGDQALLRGDDVTAEALVQEAYEIGRTTEQPGAFTIFAAGMHSVRWHQGRLAEVGVLLAEAAANDPNLNILGVSAAPAPDDAPDMEDEDELTRELRLTPHDAAWLISITVLAEKAARQRHKAVSTALYEAVLPYDGLFAGSTAALRGPVSHTLGILAGALGDHTSARMHLLEARALNDRMQAPFHQARTELALAEVCGISGDSVAARDHATRALHLAAEHHCAQVARRAERFLDGIGI